MTPKQPFWTPWDYAQDVELIADGITMVSTAGHGGIKLSPERHKVIQRRFPDFTPFAHHGLNVADLSTGIGWYEEDCDVALVIYCFPEHFSEKSLGHAQNAIAADPQYFGREVK